MALTRQDIDNAVGSENVSRWADINNSGSTTEIDARVTWAINLATEEMRTKLRRLPYDLTQMESNASVIHYTAIAAANLLYGPRAIQDEQDPSKNLMAMQMDNLKAFLKDLEINIRELGLSRTTRPYPTVYREESGKSYPTGPE